MNVEKLLTYCIERLVDNPQAVSVTRTELADKISFEIKVDPSDRARVIGREGRTFKALRALINIPSPDTHHELVIETL